MWNEALTAKTLDDFMKMTEEQRREEAALEERDRRTLQMIKSLPGADVATRFCLAFRFVGRTLSRKTLLSLYDKDDGARANWVDRELGDMEREGFIFEKDSERIHLSRFPASSKLD
jgi:hypothetical protein